jgi:tetratricopeptide (TPR) repeat protein
VRRCKIVLAGSALAFLAVWSCGPARTYTPTPVPAWDYVRSEFPEAPPDLPERDQRGFEQAWHHLLEGDLESAAGELERLERRHRNNASVESALGFLELRLGNRRAAESHFAAALETAPSLPAAQSGWAITALADGREEEAFERLLVLEREHPDDALVRDYLPGLQLKLAESKLQSARSLRRSERYAEAAEAYRDALRIAPAVGGLYAEAAEVELLAGEPEQAAAHAAEALDIEPESVRLYRLWGDALRASGNLEMALEAYRKARDLRPEDTSLAALVDDMRRELERDVLPPEYLEISRSERVTREQLAALLFVQFRSIVENAGEGTQVIATDIAGSWAREFIRAVVAAGILDVFPNHTFRPEDFVRRGDLAVALTAVVDAVDPDPDVFSLPELTIQDVSPANLNYRSVALVAGLGIMPLDAEGRFEPLRFVSGREAVDAVEALATRIASDG